MNPIDQARIANYYDAFLPHLAADHQRDNARIGRIKLALSALVHPGVTVLDLGCGTGITSRWMAQLGATVVAVDISPSNIAFAAEHSAHPAVAYVCDDITALAGGQFGPGPGGPFHTYDVIVLADVFEHVPEDSIPDLMAVIARHSHAETRVYLNIPDGRYQDAARGMIPDRLQIVDNSYPLYQVLTLFRRIGFEATNIDIYGIDVACQYNAFNFRRREALTATYKSMMVSNTAG